MTNAWLKVESLFTGKKKKKKSLFNLYPLLKCEPKTLSAAFKSVQRDKTWHFCVARWRVSTKSTTKQKSQVFDYRCGGGGKKKQLTKRWQNNSSFAGQLTDMKTRSLKSKRDVSGELLPLANVRWSVDVPRKCCDSCAQRMLRLFPKQKKKNPKIKWAATMKKNYERGGLSLHPVDFLQDLRHIRASIHVLESNECNNLGPVFSFPFMTCVFMRRELTRRGMSRTPTNGHVPLRPWRVRVVGVFLPPAENGRHWEEERCGLPRVKSNGLRC